MNPFDLMKNMGNIKNELTKVQEELSEITETGSSGGGIVKVTIDGTMQIVNIQLDPIAVDPRDIPMLQDLIVAASRDANTKIKDRIQEKMGPMLGGLNIPGLNL